jgi:hypothetical protein
MKKKKSAIASLKWWDWLLFAVLATACFFLFVQKDLELTADNSYLLLEGHVLDFYSAVIAWCGGPAANYLPPTFLVFALWNLPIFLLGKAPVVLYSSSVIKIVWYKLLPVILYFISGLLIKSICRKELGFSDNKAKLAMYLFYTAPLAFFSQFIISQYDIFTGMLMLLGLRFYLRQDATKMDHWLFVLFFALAATFKYFALAVFFILLVLKDKQIARLVGSALLVFLPVLAISLPFYLADNAAFSESVLGFRVLGFVASGGISLGHASIHLLPAALLLLLIWAYLIRPKDRRQFVCYAFYLGSGVLFALFGLMYWHPQWLIVGVPFWTISLLMNRNAALFIWLDTVLVVPFTVYVVNTFSNNVDQDMLKHMVFTPWLRGKATEGSLMMKDIFPTIDPSMLFTIMTVLFLVWFLLRHPRFCSDDIAQELDNQPEDFSPLSTMTAIRIRFLVGVFFFAVPALLCLPSMLMLAASGI